MVATETDRGLFAGALVAAGYVVRAVNPLWTSTYRQRHSTSGAKSDPGDAKVLADLARTDAHNHRRVAGDSKLGEAVEVLARAHQSMIGTRQRQTNSCARRCASSTRAPSPPSMTSPDATPCRCSRSPRLRRPDVSCRARRSPPRSAGPAGSGASTLAPVEIQTALRAEQLSAAPLIADAMGATVTALVAVIAELQAQVARLESELADRF